MSISVFNRLRQKAERIKNFYVSFLCQIYAIKSMLFFNSFDYIIIVFNRTGPGFTLMK